MLKKLPSTDKIEEEIEDLIPKKAVKEVSRRPFIYLTAAIIAIIAIGALATMQFVNASNLSQQEAKVE